VNGRPGKMAGGHAGGPTDWAWPSAPESPRSYVRRPRPPRCTLSPRSPASRPTVGSSSHRPSKQRKRIHVDNGDDEDHPPSAPSKPSAKGNDTLPRILRPKPKCGSSPLLAIGETVCGGSDRRDLQIDGVGDVDPHTGSGFPTAAPLLTWWAGPRRKLVREGRSWRDRIEERPAGQCDDHDD